MNEHNHPDLLDDALALESTHIEGPRQAEPSGLCPVCFSRQTRVLENELFSHGCQWCGACW